MSLCMAGSEQEAFFDLTLKQNVEKAFEQVAITLQVMTSNYHLANALLLFIIKSIFCRQ